MQSRVRLDLTRWVGLVFVAAVAWNALVSVASGGQTRAQLPPLAIESLGPTESFLFYCSPCHGRSGTGDGPVASALRTRPADLTTLAERSGGRFPRERVRDYVAGKGRPVAAHGANDMPVWGPAFQALDGSDVKAEVRIDGLVSYVESLQSGQNGALLYRQHCASCHGTSGKGNGPAAAELRKVMPDLTLFTTRNGGVFPEERVRRIIDGRDVPAHGDREMPVWGATFKRASPEGTDEAANTRIEALVRFLRSMQERPAE